MIKDIEERKENADSFRDWFADGWERNKSCIDDLIEHNRKMSEDIEYLLSLVKKQREALEVEFANENNWEMVETTRSDGTKIKVPSWKWGLEPWKLAQQALKEQEKENEYIIHYTEGTDTRVKSFRCRDYTWEQAKFRFLSSHPNATINK